MHQELKLAKTTTLLVSAIHLISITNTWEATAQKLAIYADLICLTSHGNAI